MVELNTWRINLRTAMDHRGVSRAALCQRAEMEPADLDRLLAGQVRPTAADCERLAAELGIAPADLDRRPSQFKIRLREGRLDGSPPKQEPPPLKKKAEPLLVAQVVNADTLVAQKSSDWMTDAWRFQRRKRIAERVATTGCTLEQAAYEFGVSVAVARRACVLHGVEVPVTLPAAERARRRAEIADYVARHGCTARQAAQELGTSVARVLRACREHGVVPASAKLLSVFEQRRREIAQWIADHDATCTAAAAHFLVSTSTVHAACRDQGIPSSPSARQEALLRLRVLALLLEGNSPSHVAGETGVRAQYIEQCVKNAAAAGLIAAIEKAVRAGDAGASLAGLSLASSSLASPTLSGKVGPGGDASE